MDASIQKLLRKYYVDGVFHTHVSLISPKGRYHFDRQGLEEFWEEYCKLVHESDSYMLGVAEKPEHYLPVLVDVDLKMKDEGDREDSSRLYTEAQVREVIQIYQSILRQIVENCSDEKLTCVLLEKEPYIVTKGDVTYIKNGFHLHFPYCFLNKVEQEIHLIPRVKHEMNESKTFASLGLLEE